MKNKFTDVSFIIREKSIEEEKQPESENTKEYLIIRGKTKLRKGYVEYKVLAHKFILASRSPLFSEMFKKNSAKTTLLDIKESGINGENTNETIIIKDTTFKAFKIVIDYIYLDNLSILDEIHGCSELTEILKLAKLYQLNALLDKCERQFLSLSSLQLLRNLITNSFSTNPSLKRSKDKKLIGARNFPPEANFLD